MVQRQDHLNAVLLDKGFIVFIEVGVQRFSLHIIRRAGNAYVVAIHICQSFDSKMIGVL